MSTALCDLAPTKWATVSYVRFDYVQVCHEDLASRHGFSRRLSISA